MPTILTAAVLGGSGKTDAESYCNCMEEIRCRVTVIKGVVNGSISTQYLAFNQELAFVQFRMILELMAFGSIIANKAVYSATYKKFSEHWHAERILKDLEKVNPHFYPVALGPCERQPDGVKHFKGATEPVPTKDDFIFLYNTCGKMLHTRNPFTKEDPNIPLRYSVTDWVSRIEKLLSSHLVGLLDGNLWIVTIPSRGAIHAAIAPPKPGIAHGEGEGN